MMERKRRFIILLGFWLIAILLIGIVSTSTAYESKYEVLTSRGTTYLEQTKYDDDAWEDIISDTNEPDDWFEGDADETGAKSKYTIRSILDTEWETSDIFMLVFEIEDAIPNDVSEKEMVALMTFFDEDTINEMYPNEYEIWTALCSEWDFTVENFDEEADDENEQRLIFKDAEDLKDMLNDYNDWVSEINTTALMIFGTNPFPIFSGDDFLWNLVINGYPIASPFNEYLADIVNELDCENAEVKGSTLIIEKEGEDEYIVEVSYDDQGIQSSFIVKDEDDNIIFEIISDNTITVVSLAIGFVLIIAIVSIVTIIVRKKRKSKID